MMMNRSSVDAESQLRQREMSDQHIPLSSSL